jgi:hypothetical protein
MHRLIIGSIEFVESVSARAFRACGIATLCFSALLSIVMLMMRNTYAVNVFPCDLIIFFDSAWRVNCGQLPHTDFYCPLGALIPFIFAFALKTMPDMNVFAVVPLMAYFPVALALYYIGKDRVPAFWLFFFQVFLGICVVAPRPLGYPLGSLSPAMLFNRWGEALVALFFLKVFFASYQPLPLRKDILEHVLLGVILALLMFLKISYFEMVSLTVAWHLLVNRPSIKCLGAMTGGFALIVLFFVSQGIHLSDMFADFHMLSAAQDWRLRMLQTAMKALGICPKGFYAGSDLGCEGLFPYVEVIVILLLAAMKVGKPSKKYKWHIVLITLLIFTSGWAFYTFNFQIGDPVVAAIAPIFVLHCISRARLKMTDLADNRSALLYLGGLLIGFSFAITITAKDLISVVFAAETANRPDHSSQEIIKSDRVKGIAWPESYASYINSGLELVRANGFANAKICTFDFVNPFPFLLGARPPRGNALWWFANLSFNMESHPSLERALGDADVVLVPAIRNEYNYSPMPDMRTIYGAYLAEHFMRQAGNDSWELFVRHKSPAQQF